MNTGGFPVLDVNCNKNRELIKVGDKVVGCLRDRTFVKRMQGSRHMLRRPLAWCISKEAFYEEVLSNSENIVIEDLESGLVYECLTQVFAKHSFEIQRGNYEPQLALTLNYWERHGDGHRQLRLFEGGDASA
jgi:hypothetical protein